MIHMLQTSQFIPVMCEDKTAVNYRTRGLDALLT